MNKDTNEIVESYNDAFDPAPAIANPRVYQDQGATFGGGGGGGGGGDTQSPDFCTVFCDLASSVRG
ncbi:hypothetical protein [Actibacterium ureilyticum]|uniref:hypothetical protein n=1 Tax=Actibacterium ureilyticum TaxID=1590614 RepID=UPI000BAAEB90|nr:hypothetical protein [Actibacterium ureilyticum]